ncbi:Rossmann-like and DUF2520 domain-containing protein [Clostridium sp. WILCCON 0269]|uniref:Rossmann-like and DUF2520 domain-containing protein n=1 Tax=Candidatus Clostridium eludens TaxID=3381663 RepID=A0ABW8SIT6_9CLOT
MKFNIGFIGAGRVGVTLGKYFPVNEVNLKGYYSKSESSAKEAASFTSSSYYSELKALIEDCNVIFITTPDDIIKEVWNKIKKYKLKDKIICHSSGSLSSSIFSDIDTLGAFGYSIHPMCAFSDKFNTYKTLYKIYFSIEGHDMYLSDLKLLFEKMGNNIIVLDKSKKPLYHLASVTVSNLVLSLLDVGCSYLGECGIDKGVAISALMPLIDNNLTNIKNKGFINALTGPVERGDIETIKHHLEVIPEKDKALYKRLSLNLVNLSEKKHIEKNWDNIKNELGGKECHEK